MKKSITGVKALVLSSGLIGVLMTFVLTFNQGLLIPVLVAAPFFLALLSFLSNSLERRRRMWLASAILTGIIGLPLLVIGVGFFFLLLALAFGWAFTTTRDRIPAAAY